ncbi:MAG: NAD(P)H-dependent oxidoreductase [Pseudomonadota bacterium]|nr:NAD(P)H-dependent oxidoreductase [Pseudomonadota bacterium]
MNILHLDSGLFAGQSLTRSLAAKLVQSLQSRNADGAVIYRDLVKNAPAHLDATILLAAGKPEAERSDYEREQLHLSQTLLDELFAADVIVIGAPMYNFTIPSQLKAWLDRVLQAGKTFRYTSEGAEGLVKGKRAFIVSSRGGVYTSGPAAAMEHQESYLLAALAFIGITDVQVIRAEGVNMGEALKAQALEQAEANIAGVRLEDAPQLQRCA